MNVEVFSPGKLTKYLKLVGTRSNGMHELESEMVSLSFGDTLQLSEGSGIEILDVDQILEVLGRELDEIPTDASNLISKALHAVGNELHVRVLKRIPPGSGLGGGSSNAAAILRYFLGGDTDISAESLGADVPFCIKGGRALARGVGEILEPLPYKFETLVLLLSPFGVATGDVYRQFDLVGAGTGNGANDLEQAAIICEPRLRESRALLKSLSGSEPTLAGTGSTYFVSGSFETIDLAMIPIVKNGIRYADLEAGEKQYRLVEVATLPAMA